MRGAVGVAIVIARRVAEAMRAEGRPLLPHSGNRQPPAIGATGAGGASTRAGRGIRARMRARRAASTCGPGLGWRAAGGSGGGRRGSAATFSARAARRLAWVARALASRRMGLSRPGRFSRCALPTTAFFEKPRRRPISLALCPASQSSRSCAMAASSHTASPISAAPRAGRGRGACGAARGRRDHSSGHPTTPRCGSPPAIAIPACISPSSSASVARSFAACSRRTC